MELLNEKVNILNDKIIERLRQKKIINNFTWEKYHDLTLQYLNYKKLDQIKKALDVNEIINDFTKTFWEVQEENQTLVYQVKKDLFTYLLDQQSKNKLDDLFKNKFVNPTNIEIIYTAKAQEFYHLFQLSFGHIKLDTSLSIFNQYPISLNDLLAIIFYLNKSSKKQHGGGLLKKYLQIKKKYLKLKKFQLRLHAFQ